MSQLTLDMPATDVQLVTIPNVELVSVGVWNASTGPVEFTPEHLQAAIAALADPAVHAPRLRIGHTPGNIPPQQSAGGVAGPPSPGSLFGWAWSCGCDGPGRPTTGALAAG